MNKCAEHVNINHLEDSIFYNTIISYDADASKHKNKQAPLINSLELCTSDTLHTLCVLYHMPDNCGMKTEALKCLVVNCDWLQILTIDKHMWQQYFSLRTCTLTDCLSV